MIEQLQTLAVEFQNIKSELTEFFKNKDIPIEQRWTAFDFAIDHNIYVNIDSCYHSSSILEDKNLTWYDDFNLDRYATATFPQIFDQLIELDVDITDEELLEIKEEFLQSGYSGFTNDW